MFKYSVRTTFASALVLGATLCGSASMASAAPTVVARVNGEEIKLEDVNKLKAALPKQLIEQAKDEKKLFEGLRDQLIQIKLVTDAAKKSDLEKEAEVQKEIERAKEQVIIRAYLAKEMQKHVSEKAVKERYDQLVKDIPKDKKETRASHILVKDEKVAKDIIQRIQKGEDFKKLAREHSIDRASADKGGDLDYFTEEGMIPEFAKVAFQLKPNEVSKEPVKSQHGYHIIKVTDRRNLRPPKFEDVKERVESDVAQRAMAELVSQLEKQAKVEKFNKDGSPVKK